MPDWDLLLTDANIASMRSDSEAYGIIPQGALAICAGKIGWIGPMSELPQSNPVEQRSVEGRWLTPALIDCHSHLVFGGHRAREFEQRLNGASYEEIAHSGGGILSTVEATRSSSLDQLIASARKRLDALSKEGVATVEIKSGYGLDVETELKMLRAARELGGQSSTDVVTTFLGAHALPPEFDGRSDDYIDHVVTEMLPSVHEQELADAVDAFCENIAFSVEQVARVFDCARSLGLPVKLHADQLSDGRGAELAARYNALSADHLEYTSKAGIAAMAEAGTVAVLLPGAFLMLGESQLPPIAAMRELGVPIAVATDCNPGSSPMCSVLTALSLSSSLFRLSPEECLAGVTRNAARALGLAADRGTLEVGKRADIALWDIEHPRELSYWLGLNPLQQLWVNGCS